MKEYSAPLADMRFVLDELANAKTVLSLPPFESIDEDVVAAILEEAAKFSSQVLSPLNSVGDKVGARWAAGQVTTAPGWRQAYEQFVAGGWPGLSIDEQAGGQGLPRVVAAVVNEMWKSANLAFSLCPMLTVGAVEAILLRGSDPLKKTFVPRMVTGEWTGTMNLTEPQAGSDLAAIRTRAERQADGTYRLFGQKIYITYGEHDLAENIIHMVLVRVSDAPPGVKGISLFLVPKVLVNADGSLGARNDVQSVSIEHKLGIHGSPTSVMAYGDQGGAVGYLVGEENRGLEIMFIMMNAARFAVGQEGVAISERAFQAARDYARERVQGSPPGRAGERLSIIAHPDVRRMLMLMKSQTEAMRALSLVVAASLDRGAHHPADDERAFHQAVAELLVPVVKGWCTETGVEVASTAIQVFGGMGYIEDTGVAQFLRDARITTIYEGTTAIQANDLVGRKLMRDDGAAMRDVLACMYGTVSALSGLPGDCGAIRAQLVAAVDAVDKAQIFLRERQSTDPTAALAGSVPFLKLLGITAGGWQMARAAIASVRALAEGRADAAFYQAKINTARFYADHMLSAAPGLAHVVVAGAPGTLGADEDTF